MMEDQFIPSADPTFVPAAPPVLIPPHERAEAPLLHDGFSRLFWLSVASMLINLLTNSFRLTERVPALRVPLSLAALAVGVLMIVSMWKMSAAVPRFRKAAVWNALPLAAAPALLWVDLAGVTQSLGEKNLGTLSFFVILVLALTLAVGMTARWHQLAACAEAFDGSDEVLAGKWRRLRTWVLALMAMLGAFLALTVMLIVSQGGYFLFFGGTAMLLIVAAVTIGIAVTSIIDLVYLHRAADLFA